MPSSEVSERVPDGFFAVVIQQLLLSFQASSILTAKSPGAFFFLGARKSYKAVFRRCDGGRHWMTQTKKTGGFF